MIARAEMVAVNSVVGVKKWPYCCRLLLPPKAKILHFCHSDGHAR